jgi:hypothetical protein
LTVTRQTVTAAGLAAAVLAAAALAGANFVSEGENGGAGPYAVTLGISLALAAGMFGWAIPRSSRPGRDGLVAAAFALLSLPVYWTGLPYVLGPAALVLGLIGRARPQGRGVATTAAVLGALATVAAIAAVVADGAF